MNVNWVQFRKYYRSNKFLTNWLKSLAKRQFVEYQRL
jgi:hypothetical protein